MGWYKGKQRDVRPATKDDKGYDPAKSQVMYKMDDGTEEMVDAASAQEGANEEAGAGSPSKASTKK